MKKDGLKIKFLKAAQLDEVRSVLMQAFGRLDPGLDLALRLSLSGGNYRPVTFVAMQNNRAVGTITCGTDPQCEKSRWHTIAGLAVAGNSQHRGVGHRLVRHAEDYIAHAWLKGQPGRVGLLDGTKRARPGSDFYESMGYGPDSRYSSDRPILSKPLNILPAEKHLAARL